MPRVPPITMRRVRKLPTLTLNSTGLATAVAKGATIVLVSPRRSIPVFFDMFDEHATLVHAAQVRPFGDIAPPDPPKKKKQPCRRRK